jgi:exodeoxyribonuclease VII large subunit
MARKRPLPKFPAHLGIITSPSGAAVRDILNVLRRRAPGVHILISPVRVQGSGAAAEIATAIRELSAPNKLWPPLDLIVLARGGGSIEDLWEFNEEIVARAIFHCAIPIVSAIGHEVDFTIADFVADLRAPTPSAAAELIVPDFAEVNRRIDELAACLRRCLRNFLSHQQTRLRFLSERALSRELLKRIRDAQQQIDYTRDSLRRGARQRVADARARLANFSSLVRSHNPQREVIALGKGFADLRKRLDALAPRSLDQARQNFLRLEGILRALGPESTLRRGYSITTDVKGKILHTVKLVRPKMKIRTRVSDGEFGSEVT